MRSWPRGTSPRMRGKHKPFSLNRIPAGNIPAYAGKTLGCFSWFPQGWEHPRVCGENVAMPAAWAVDAGTSPRMRGKQRLTGCVRGVMWNIPAYAGKTPPNHFGMVNATEHPRVCGENPRVGVGEGLGVGTSPRMRENFPQPRARARRGGTSPRMRGKPSGPRTATSSRRNIPAYAGKTLTSFLACGKVLEHPRVCGENWGEAGENIKNRGTSPRMRGKRGRGVA